MIRSALRALLAEVVDYAGLFPPAGLDMRSAVGNYARYLASEDAWALGRFVAPAARLDEFAEVRAALPGHRATDAAWRLSVTLSEDTAADVERVREFNRAHGGLARVDVVEVRADSAAAIDGASRLGRGLMVFVEVPVHEDPRVLVSAARDSGVNAKIRMGGTTPDAFPSTEAVVRFLRCCHELAVPFKATAGLHHPWRGTYPLTYAQGSACATMYGFLNVLLAAALAYSDAADDVIAETLQAPDTRMLRVDDDGVSVAGVRIGSGDLRRVRDQALVSFGSCSFREPMDELRAAGLL